MKNDLTLNQAIAEHFDIDGRTLPAFKSAKPVLEARNWLNENGYKNEYHQHALPSDNKGIVIYARGGNPMFAVIDGDSSPVQGSTIYGSFSRVIETKPAKKSSRKSKAVTEESDDTSDE